LKESLQPDRERAMRLNGELERQPKVQAEAEELETHLRERALQVSESEKSLVDLAFSDVGHKKLIQDFDTAAAELHAALLAVEKQRGDFNTATAILGQVEREEDTYKSRVKNLEDKRSLRLHLFEVAKALEQLRAELNDRIRPELESIASELLSEMTDGRYSTLKIDDNYKAVIVDDGEEKPVISGGEDDIVNLALRLAVSQMIADRAGQSLSLLVLDEVFGSLDDVRRDNVVSLLQNLKNRFEQIILITHVEAIHDAVDNCLWVAFDEKTKTSRLVDRSSLTEPTPAGALL
jgi:exonuclease SbcC